MISGRYNIPNKQISDIFIVSQAVWSPFVLQTTPTNITQDDPRGTTRVDPKKDTSDDPDDPGKAGYQLTPMATRVLSTH